MIRGGSLSLVIAALSLAACTVGKDGKDGAQGAAGVPCQGCVTSDSIAAGAVTGSALAPGAVTGTAIQDGSVGTPAFAAKSVTGAILADGAVTTTNIATGAVTSDGLADGTVTTTKIAPAAVDGNAIAAGAVDGSKIAAGAITGGNIANGTIDGSNINPGTTITANNLVYAPAKVGRVTVQAYAFVPQNNAITWDGAVVFGNGFRTITGGTPLVMAAPVFFPDGATLTNLSARVYDGTTTAHETIYLRRFDGSSGASNVALVATTDADAGGYVTRSVPMAVVVNNAGNAAYFLAWELSAAGNTGSGPGLYSVEIDYTYTSP